MTRKLIYFVRHGESILNAQNIRQGSEGGLSEKGKAQALETGKRLATYSLQAMLVSPYERAQETATIINTCLSYAQKIETIDLLQERRNPQEIIGKSIYDTEVIHAVDAMDKSYHPDDFRYADEENFNDLKKRAEKTLALLSKRHEKHIVVITHGIFLRMIVASIIYGQELTASNYNSLSFYNPSNNASITVCTYTKPWYQFFKNGTWQVLAWDDHLQDSKIKSRGI